MIIASNRRGIIAAMLAKTELTRAIKAEAQRQGFHLVGVTTPEPPAHLDVYARWLDAGYHAGMDWMASERARQRRADPRLILPECESILMLGFVYEAPSPPTPLPVGEGRRGEGKIAAYAQEQDYHDVLPPRLRAIVEFIEAQVGYSVPNRWYTDTGPVLERELAQRAGLGWVGKNSNLIHPKAGSYFLLAEILLGVELTPDAPFLQDHCGTCTRCLDACPTACILPDRTIDANRCISYLTIEHKGAFPQDLRPKVGNWIFGCDICQQVCPWNKALTPPPSPLPSPNAGRREGEKNFPTDLGEDGRWGLLTEELALTPQAFNRKFKGTPIKRTKRRGYLRNIAVALGNIGGADAAPALAQALRDTEPLVRGHAAWALGKIGGEAAHAALKSAAESESDPDVLAEIQAALALMKQTRC